MYKLMAFDLDGTLLTSNGEVSERTLSALASLKASGCHIVLATARPYYRVKKYAELLEVATAQDCVITFNGGLVLTGDGQEKLGRTPFERPALLELLRYGIEIDADIFVYVDGGLLANRDHPPYRKKNPDVNFTVCDLMSIDWTQEDAYKAAYVADPATCKAIRAALPQSIVSSFEVSSSVPQFVDFAPKGVTKSCALAQISDSFGVSPREMVAFGDQDNDIPMLDFAGLAVAMENSPDIVKQHADFITLSNDEDGVAHAIAKLGLGAADRVV